MLRHLFSTSSQRSSPLRGIGRVCPDLRAPLIAFLTATTASLSAESAPSWVEDTFEDFRDGTFLDGGSNLYVSARGRVQIINRWDLNNDGFLDIVMPAGHGHTEKENIRIYLNGGQDISGRSLIEIPGCGTRDGVVLDLNRDGFNDLAVANNSDSHFRDVDAWVYWGSPSGLTADNRTELPAFRATSVTAGDFDGDSWVDLAFACQWKQSADDEAVSLIYWNSPEGFQVDNRLRLNYGDAQVVGRFSSVDLDGDGIDDLIAATSTSTVISLSSRDALRRPDARIVLDVGGLGVCVGNVNGDEFPDLAVCGKGFVAVIRGSSEGFAASEIETLKVSQPRDLELADVNGDGLDDIVVANFATVGGATWTDSYVFYAGSDGFSEGAMEALPTLGATAISAGDLNADGFPELVFSNSRSTNEMNLLSYVYWNRNGKFRFGDHTQLATPGTLGNAIGDVDHDGLPDVMFFSDEGGSRDGPTTSYVYWGDGTRNFSIERRTGFGTHHIFGQGHADLNDDGWVDLIFCEDNFNSYIAHEQSGLIFYWGNDSGFSGPSNLTMESAYGGVRIADINRDGYLDVLSGGAVFDLDDPETRGFPIFWGAPEGFQHQNRTVIPFSIEKIRGPLLMDLNRDGWLDIAGQLETGTVTLWWGGEAGFSSGRVTTLDLERPDPLMYLKAADFNQDGWLDLFLPQRGPPEGTEMSSFIYYGSPGGFANDRRTEIRTYVAYQNSIADLDRDGWLDIFVTSYGGEFSGNRPSLIYWGSEQGFDARPRTELTSYGSSGSETLDYDGDGWLDILVANHRRSGSIYHPAAHQHTMESMLYWGGPDGFSSEQRWEVVAAGPSGLNLRDLGNSYDRGLYEDYVSSVFEIPENARPDRLVFAAETPHDTGVMFQVRTAEKIQDLVSASWDGPDGPGSWYGISGARLPRVTGAFVQYRARLTTPNGAASPYLERVEVTFTE
jgi:hypothetical protein